MRLLLKIGIAVGVMLAAFSASTAYACGCGIYIPREGEVNVEQERALVRWDGQREEIVMSLGVLGASTEAAIIMPVPAPAKVTLGDGDLFDELAEMTKPLEREEIEWVWGLGTEGVGAGAPGAMVRGAPPVSVLSRQTVGPFDVANLAAIDTDALQGWLDENGFEMDEGVTALMQPYVEGNWTFVAVRMSPDVAGEELGGDLQPLTISFDSDKLVYPMRASANAENSQTLYLYVLADHRVNKENAFGDSRVAYADWVDASALPAGSALLPFVTKRMFMTKFVDTVIPSQVDSDFQFAFAPQDTQYREVIVRRVQQDISGIALLACLGLVALGVIGVGLLAIVISRRQRVAVG